MPLLIQMAWLINIVRCQETDDDIVRPATRRLLWSLPRSGDAKVALRLLGSYWLAGCDFPS